MCKYFTQLIVLSTKELWVLLVADGVNQFFPFISLYSFLSLQSPRCCAWSTVREVTCGLGWNSWLGWSPRHSNQVIPSNLLHRPRRTTAISHPPHLLPSSKSPHFSSWLIAGRDGIWGCASPAAEGAWWALKGLQLHGVISATDPWGMKNISLAPELSIILFSVLCNRIHMMVFFQKSAPRRSLSTLKNWYSSSFQKMKMT